MERKSQQHTRSKKNSAGNKTANKAASNSAMTDNITQQQNINKAIPIENQFNNKQQTNSMAIASLVLGLAGCVLCAGGGIGAIAGLILGIIALNQISKNPEQEGKGFAIAGIILNSLCLLGIILAIIVYGAVIIAAIMAQ